MEKRRNDLDQKLVARLKEIVGPQWVTDDPWELCAYARAWSYELHRRPEVIVKSERRSPSPSSSRVSPIVTSSPAGAKVSRKI